MACGCIIMIMVVAGLVMIVADYGLKTLIVGILIEPVAALLYLFGFFMMGLPLLLWEGLRKGVARLIKALFRKHD